MMTLTETVEPNAIVKALGGVVANGNAVERCVAISSLAKLPDQNALDVLLTARLDEDEDVRADAILALAKFGGPEVESALLENLTHDPVHEVKMAAINGLGKIRSKTAVPLLCRLARERTDQVLPDAPGPSDGWDDWLEIQVAAIAALGEIGDESSATSIVTAMTDEFAQDLWSDGLSALLKLGSVGANAAIDFLASAPERAREQVASKLIQARCALPSRSAEILANDASARLRAIAIEHLDSSYDHVSELMRDPDPQVRVKAIEKFAKSSPDLLEIAFDDEHSHVQAAAIHGASRYLENRETFGAGLVERFGQSKSAEVCCALLDFVILHAAEEANKLAHRFSTIRSTPLEARRSAIRLLARIGGQESLVTLAKLVGDPYRPVRLEATGALASLAANDCGGLQSDVDQAALILIRALQGALIAPGTIVNDADGKVEDQRTVDAPERHGAGAAADDNAAQQNRIRIDEEGNIVETGQVQPGSTDATNKNNAPDVEPSIVTSTLEAIQADPEAASHTDLSDRDVPLSPEDLEYLALTKTRVSRKQVSIDDVRPADKDARLLAARTMGGVLREDVCQALLDTLDETDPDLRAAAADAVSRLIPKCGAATRDTIIALGRHAKDTVVFVRLGVIRALCAAESPHATGFVKAATRDAVPSIQADALLALSRQADCSFDFDAFLASPSDTVRTAAALSLARVQGAAAYKKLFTLAFKFEGVHGNKLAPILFQLDPDATKRRLIEIVSDDIDRKARMIAVGMLGELANSSSA